MRPMVADAGSRTVEFRVPGFESVELTVSTPSWEAGAKYSCLTLRSSLLEYYQGRKAARSGTGRLFPVHVELNDPVAS